MDQHIFIENVHFKKDVLVLLCLMCLVSIDPWTLFGKADKEMIVGSVHFKSVYHLSNNMTGKSS